MGVSPLYKTTTNRVIIGKRMGEHFYLEHSVKRLPARSLSLPIVYRDDGFLCALATSLQGVHLPIRDTTSFSTRSM